MIPAQVQPFTGPVYALLGKRNATQDRMLHERSIVRVRTMYRGYGRAIKGRILNLQRKRRCRHPPRILTA